MFCSGCGNLISEGLNYCSGCGRRVNDPASKDVVANLTGAVGWVGGSGFLGFMFIAILLVRKGVPLGDLTVISFFYFAALFGICYLILRQIGQLTRTKDRTTTQLTSEAADHPAYLRPAHTAQLQHPVNPGIDSIDSITDNTTRTLERDKVSRL